MCRYGNPYGRDIEDIYANKNIYLSVCADYAGLMRKRFQLPFEPVLLAEIL
jgi:hypothetical protein